MTDVAQFRITLSANRESVTLEMVLNDEIKAYGILTDAEQVDKFIAILGAVREQMNDKIPESLDPVPRLRVTHYPNWWLFDPTDKGQILALRHPQFGWLGFLFSQDKAKEIAEWLMKFYIPTK